MTPYLLVDEAKVRRNVERLRAHLDAHGTPLRPTPLRPTPLRPHVKTAKSVDVARMVFDGGTGPITVSTLREAEAFADEGFTDIVYAVGIAPSKLDRVLALRRRGVDLVVLLDGPPFPDLLMTDASQEHGTLALRPGSDHPLPDLPVGTRVRVLPNHACATAAQHDAYRLLGDAGTTWQRVNGW